MSLADLTARTLDKESDTQPSCARAEAHRMNTHSGDIVGAQQDWNPCMYEKYLVCSCHGDSMK